MKQTNTTESAAGCRSFNPMLHEDGKPTLRCRDCGRFEHEHEPFQTCVACGARFPRQAVRPGHSMLLDWQQYCVGCLLTRYQGAGVGMEGKESRAPEMVDLLRRQNNELGLRTARLEADNARLREALRLFIRWQEGPTNGDPFIEARQLLASLDGEPKPPCTCIKCQPNRPTDSTIQHA